MANKIQPLSQVINNINIRKLHVENILVIPKISKITFDEIFLILRIN